jgi:hypothetical protein
MCIIAGILTIKVTFILIIDLISRHSHVDPNRITDLEMHFNHRTDFRIQTVVFIQKVEFMKIVVFWLVAQCSVVEVSRRFRCVYRPDDGGNKHL